MTQPEHGPEPVARPLRPLRAVLQAFDDGASTLHEVGVRTGLDPDVVRAAVDHLVRTGYLDARELAVGCPGGGCSSCASGVDDGPGCGATASSVDRSGPVLVALTPARRNHLFGHGQGTRFE